MDVPTALATLKSSIDLIGLLVNERDRQKAAAIQINLTDKIIQAQVQLTEIQITIIEKNGLIQTLTQRVSELEADQSEKARYELAKFSFDGDFFAYQLRPAAELTERTNEPSHLVCQPCFNAGKKSILQTRNGYTLCAICSQSAHISTSTPVIVTRRVSRNTQLDSY